MPQSITDALPPPPTPSQIPQNLPSAPVPQVPAAALQPPGGGVPQPPAAYTPPPPPDMTGYFQQFIDQDKKRTEIMQKAGQEASAEIKENQKKREAIEPPKPPELAPAPKPQNSDPFQTFGSAAGWLAVFGSMLTRAPLTASLNAAAGAMNAAKQNNAAEFQQNMEAWKANTENALKLHQFALDTYKEDMEKLKDGDESAKTNAEVIAHSLQDDSMIAALKAGSEEAYRLYDARVKQGQATAEAADKTYQIGLALKDNQDHAKDWTSMQKAQRMAAATNPSVMNTVIRTGAAQDAKTEKANAGYDSALEQLDEIRKKVIAGGGVGVTGIAGFAQRVGETAATVVPGLGNVPTPASDLQSQMDALKLQLPKLLTGTSKSAADERAKVDTILRGLGPGDTRDKTLHSIDQLEEIIRQRKGERTTEKEDIPDSLSGVSDDEIKAQLKAQFGIQ